MSFVTLKNYLKSPGEESVSRRVISLLLQGISSHAVQIDKAEYESYRCGLDHIQAMIKEDSTGEELLVVAGRSIQAFTDYCQNTTRLIRQQSAVFQNMIAMFTQTMISIGAGGEESIHRLQSIEAQLMRAVMIDDVRQLKSNLDDCLKDVREAAAREKSEVQELVSRIQKEADCAKEKLLAGDVTDSVTGLPAHPAALALLDEWLSSPGKYFVAVAVFNRLQSINLRFGRDAGDTLIKVVSERFRSQLSAGDHLFRWRGPVLVAFLRREQSCDRVRTEIRKICQEFSEEIVDVGQRRLMVSLGASWTVIPVATSREEVIKSIESFVAGQSKENVCRISA